MEERKSMGGALVDVFDAGLTLVKSEINAVARKAGEIAKAKGIGAVLLLASTGPLILGLVFIILAVFYGLMRLGLGAWAAALIIALLSFAVTGALIFLGIKKLGTEVQMNEPRSRRSDTDSDTAPAVSSGTSKAIPATGAASHMTHNAGTHSTGGSTERDAYNPNGPRVDIGRDASNHAAGENRVTREGSGTATVRIEGGEITVPVYESKPGGEPANYGSGLNKQIDGSDAGEGHRGGTHGHRHDPNLQEPVVLKDAPGIPVSTAATFRDDMKKGGQS
ncbi:phage holin family protein [Deinococcus aquaticus]|uniref:phage holin family protein n=1 Tax=Deinococcus aquaticus TaxID=328692 RepID=UPI003F46C4D2